jgi:hypothetical protein
MDLFKLWRHSKVVVPSKHKYDPNDLIRDMHQQGKAMRAEKKKYKVKYQTLLSTGDMFCICYAEYSSSGVSLTCTVNDSDTMCPLGDRFKVNARRNNDGQYSISYNGDKFYLSDDEMNEIIHASRD